MRKWNRLLLENINPERNAAGIKTLHSELHLSVKTGNSVSVFFLDSDTAAVDTVSESCWKNTI